MVINPNLSGRAVVKVKLPFWPISKFDAVREEFAPKRIQKRFASVKGVKLERYSFTEGRYPEAIFEVSFSSLEMGAAAGVKIPPRWWWANSS